ncbi:MAG: peptide deformylase [Ruminiclostridium sp.]
MVKEINKDIILLSQKSQPTSDSDMSIAEDLLDTLKANSERCVGMAANMIGELKNIIAVNDNGSYLIMYDPEIIKADKPYDTQEGCLSLDGVRNTKRYKKIKVRYLDSSRRLKIKTFEGYTAQIIQHEIDHCNGIII